MRHCGGDHFIEIDVAFDGMQRLVIHSGSRNLGLHAAIHYQKLAVDPHSDKGEFFERKRELIDSYKAAGRRKEIQRQRAPNICNMGSKIQQIGGKWRRSISFRAISPAGVFFFASGKPVLHPRI